MTNTNNVKSFYAKYGKHIRLAANTGVYVTGFVFAAKATTVAGACIGLAAMAVGAVGVGCSAGEYFMDMIKDPAPLPRGNVYDMK